MRNGYLVLAVLSFLALIPAAYAANLPALPPAPDYPLFDIVDYDTATAQQRWEPMHESLSLTVISVSGRNALRMPCNFLGTTMDRASWDLRVPLDLTGCQELRFQCYCPDPSPVSYFRIYFRSGNGWYTAGFAPETRDGWTEVTIRKEDANIEGTPAGWSAIDLVRISAWRGVDKDTEFYVTDLGLVGAGAPIAVVRAESCAGAMPDSLKTAMSTAATLTEHLKGLGLDYTVMSDLDVTPQRLKGTKLVVLPYNPHLPDPTAAALNQYLESGGKLMSFYQLPKELAPHMGMKPGEWVRQERPGMFTSIRPANKAVVGLPAATGQASWNIEPAVPIHGKSEIAAYWHDDTGASTGHAAIVVSKNAIHMSHVLIGDDPANKPTMLLAMVGNLVPGAWRTGAQGALDRIAKFGPYNDFDQAAADIRTRAKQAGRPEAEAALAHAGNLRDLAQQLIAGRGFAKSISASGKARASLVRAYCAVQPSEKGEHRAFWCHSAFGVSGMTWDEAIKNLADNGFTAILPNMLWGGTAFYPSEVLPVAKEVATEGDQIAACLAACKKYGVECHVWKVNWNMGGHATAEFREKMRSAGRTQVMFSGKSEPKWLCPSHPANQQLEIDSMVEVATKYDVDGVHFDYIRYPDRDGCFCKGCKTRFEKVVGKQIANWPKDLRDDKALEAQWLDFRRAQITRVVKEVSDALHAMSPRREVSAAVFRNWPRDRDSIGQDWKVWCDKGYLDFVCPMDYTDSTSSFENYVTQQLTWCGKVPCYPGIGLSVWPNRTDICKLIDQIEITRKHQTGGFTIFNYGSPEANDVVPMCGLGITRK
jgi:uncharacterized lipoprotein YddW (UPF0748 family)